MNKYCLSFLLLLFQFNFFLNMYLLNFFIEIPLSFTESLTHFECPSHLLKHGSVA
jgi:hypothetical protein